MIRCLTNLAVCGYWQWATSGTPYIHSAGGDDMVHMHGESTDQDHPSPTGPCDPNNPQAENRPPTCGVHNQMMVGEQTIYLSHLPMFMFNPRHHEHNFQVILEVTLSGPDQATYVADRTIHPNERMYT